MMRRNGSRLAGDFAGGTILFLLVLFAWATGAWFLLGATAVCAAAYWATGR